MFENDKNIIKYKDGKCKCVYVLFTKTRQYVTSTLRERYHSFKTKRNALVKKARALKTIFHKFKCVFCLVVKTQTEQLIKQEKTTVHALFVGNKRTSHMFIYKKSFLHGENGYVHFSICRRIAILIKENIFFK